MEAENQTTAVDEAASGASANNQAASGASAEQDAAPNEASRAADTRAAGTPEAVPNEANSGMADAGEVSVDRPVAEGSEPAPKEANARPGDMAETAGGEEFARGPESMPNEANSVDKTASRENSEGEAAVRKEANREADIQAAPAPEAVPNEANAGGADWGEASLDQPVPEDSEPIPSEANARPSDVAESAGAEGVARGQESMPNEANAADETGSREDSEGENAVPNEASRETDTEPGAPEAVPNEANSVSADDLLPFEPPSIPNEAEDGRLKAVIEAIIYVTDEPLGLDQISAALEQPRDRIAGLLEQLAAEYERPDRGLSIREVAGGYKLSTKPEHHDAVRRFVKNLKPPLKLSLPALETLAVIAYKQPITAPEIMEIRGVQGAGVLKTLLDRKVIATAGRKNVVGKPILYKTTREFLVQFGLKDLAELPTLKEFQEIGRMDMEGAAAPNEAIEKPDGEPARAEPEQPAPETVKPGQVQ